MLLTSLGHICYLLEMESANGDGSVRILADPWLSDHAVGDLMGRFPRVRLAPDALGDIDAIFLSHAHTDHLDPASLVELWKRLEPRPKVLLPQSLKFLERLLAEHLPGAEIVFLQERRPMSLGGVTVTAFLNPELHGTNEDDVMILLAENGREAFLGESDAALPLYDPEVREFLATLLGAEGLETACFLTAKNSLEATMSMLVARGTEDRHRRLERSVESIYEEIEEIYLPLDDLEADLWSNARLVRLVGGQGMCFPQQLGGNWNHLLFPLRIADRVRMEREIAEQLDYEHTIDEFIPGMVHRLSSGKLETRFAARGVELLDDEADRRYRPDMDAPGGFPIAPLRDRERDVFGQTLRILTTLNERFLPHWIGARRPPLEHLLAANDGGYRIRVRFGTTADHADRDYCLSFGFLRFEEDDPAGDPDEFYWANDLDDFLEGRCDEFSLFCRGPLPARAQRLWNTLGLPYLNNDLVEKKLRLHFERASRGESQEEWVLSFYRPRR